MWLIAFVVSFGIIIICCSKSCYGLERSVPFAQLKQGNLHFIVLVKMEVNVQLKSCASTKKRREGERNSKC